MIKPVACPRCKTDPNIFYYQELVTERDEYCVQHKHKDGEWVQIFARTRLGAILRWNWKCFWEKRRMRRKAK